METKNRESQLSLRIVCSHESLYACCTKIIIILYKHVQDINFTLILR
jgi:hypothetical protein